LMSGTSDITKTVAALNIRNLQIFPFIMAILDTVDALSVL